MLGDFYFWGGGYIVIVVIVIYRFVFFLGVPFFYKYDWIVCCVSDKGMKSWMLLCFLLRHWSII